MSGNEIPAEENRSNRFLDFLRTAPAAEDCEQCLTQLDDYISAQLAGALVTEQFPETAVHLDSCPACAQAYALLYELVYADAGGTIAEPESIPTLDISFLGKTDSDSLIRQLKEYLQISAERITFDLNASLIPLLKPLPAASTVRQAVETRYQDLLLTLTPELAPEITLPFTLKVYRDRENVARCLAEVTVTPAGVSWPDLGGVLVRLEMNSITSEQKTDDWGTAVFPDLPLSGLEQLQLTITNH